MPETSVGARVDFIETLIPRPPADVSSLRASFSNLVSSQWQQHVLPALNDQALGWRGEQAAKVRFMAEMYARACYSMLLVSARSPFLLRCPIRLATTLPINRGNAVRCGCYLLSLLQYLLPRSVHRQLALMSSLMGVMDIAVDEAAPAGHDPVLRVASMLDSQPLTTTNPLEATLARLARLIRAGESAWQTEYWDKVLLPATRQYCSAEARGVSNLPDPTGLGHRWAGIEAAIKGMWYVIGPHMGLDESTDHFQRRHWSREQQWMADTSLLMQMIDDWVDQDQDRGKRSTPVTEGAWKPHAIQQLYAKTTIDLVGLLVGAGIRKKVFKDLFSDLYADYVYAALEAMQSGLAA